jgi:hypothetical protein
MMGYWLEKVLGADDDGNNLTKLVPLVIFFVIWLFSAIAKAAQKGKKGEEKELSKGQEKQEPGFDELAKKIRERYAAAKEQARREAEQEENDGRLEPPAQVPQRNAAATPYRGVPPASPTQSAAGPRPPMFEVTEVAGQPQIKKPVAPPMQYQEGPTLKVVKGLQNTDVGDHLEIEKPTLLKVDSALQKVDELTSENAKVSGEVEIHQQHPYLAELAEQFTHADGFRKAILNYEILGPPLSLRE